MFLYNILIVIFMFLFSISKHFWKVIRPLRIRIYLHYECTICVVMLLFVYYLPGSFISGGYLSMSIFVWKCQYFFSIPSQRKTKESYSGLAFTLVCTFTNPLFYHVFLWIHCHVWLFYGKAAEAMMVIYDGVGLCEKVKYIQGGH